MGKKVNIKLAVEELLDMLEKAGGHVTSRSHCYDGVELEITMCPDKYDSALEFEVEVVPTKVPKYVADWLDDRVSVTSALNTYYEEINVMVDLWLSTNKPQGMTTSEFIAYLKLHGYETAVPEYVVRIGKGVLEGSFFTDFDESYFDWADNRPNYYGDDRIESARKFTDKEQAEAVATLINGEVEEYYG